jgi:hypothetical protein
VRASQQTRRKEKETRVQSGSNAYMSSFLKQSY